MIDSRAIRGGFPPRGWPESLGSDSHGSLPDKIFYVMVASMVAPRQWPDPVVGAFTNRESCGILLVRDSLRAGALRGRSAQCADRRGPFFPFTHHGTATQPVCPPTRWTSRRPRTPGSDTLLTVARGEPEREPLDREREGGCVPTGP